MSACSLHRLNNVHNYTCTTCTHVHSHIDVGVFVMVSYMRTCCACVSHAQHVCNQRPHQCDCIHDCMYDCLFSHLTCLHVFIYVYVRVHIQMHVRQQHRTKESK